MDFDDEIRRSGRLTGINLSRKIVQGKVQVGLCMTLLLLLFSFLSSASSSSLADCLDGEAKGDDDEDWTCLIRNGSYVIAGKPNIIITKSCRIYDELASELKVARLATRAKFDCSHASNIIIPIFMNEWMG